MREKSTNTKFRRHSLAILIAGIMSCNSNATFAQDNETKEAADDGMME